MDKKRKFLTGNRVFLLLLVLLPTLAVLGRNTICTRMKVDGDSMLPNYAPGERFTTYHLAYRLKGWRWDFPKRGEVITCRSPRRREVIVLKRVIGLPGDEIIIKSGIIYLNGKPTSKTAVGDGIFRETLDGVTWRTLESGTSNWPEDGVPHRVGADAVFVLGDHRDESIDSRILGDVPFDLITGRVR